MLFVSLAAREVLNPDSIAPLSQLKKYERIEKALAPSYATFSKWIRLLDSLEATPPVIYALLLKRVYKVLVSPQEYFQRAISKQQKRLRKIANADKEEDNGTTFEATKAKNKKKKNVRVIVDEDEEKNEEEGTEEEEEEVESSSTDEGEQDDDSDIILPSDELEAPHNLKDAEEEAESDSLPIPPSVDLKWEWDDRDEVTYKKYGPVIASRDEASVLRSHGYTAEFERIRDALVEVGFVEKETAVERSLRIEKEEGGANGKPAQKGSSSGPKPTRYVGLISHAPAKAEVFQSFMRVSGVCRNLTDEPLAAFFTFQQTDDFKLSYVNMRGGIADNGLAAFDSAFIDFLNNNKKVPTAPSSKDAWRVAFVLNNTDNGTLLVAGKGAIAWILYEDGAVEKHEAPTFLVLSKPASVVLGSNFALSSPALELAADQKRNKLTPDAIARSEFSRYAALHDFRETIRAGIFVCFVSLSVPSARIAYANGASDAVKKEYGAEMLRAEPSFYKWGYSRKWLEGGLGEQGAKAVALVVESLYRKSLYMRNAWANLLSQDARFYTLQEAMILAIRGTQTVIDFMESKERELGHKKRSKKRSGVISRKNFSAAYKAFSARYFGVGFSSTKAPALSVVYPDIKWEALYGKEKYLSIVDAPTRGRIRALHTSAISAQLLEAYVRQKFWDKPHDIEKIINDALAPSKENDNKEKEEEEEEEDESPKVSASLTYEEVVLAFKKDLEERLSQIEGIDREAGTSKYINGVSVKMELMLTFFMAQALRAANEYREKYKDILAIYRDSSISYAQKYTFLEPLVGQYNVDAPFLASISEALNLYLISIIDVVAAVQFYAVDSTLFFDLEALSRGDYAFLVSGGHDTAALERSAKHTLGISLDEIDKRIPLDKEIKLLDEWIDLGGTKAELEQIDQEKILGLNGKRKRESLKSDFKRKALARVRALQKKFIYSDISGFYSQFTIDSKYLLAFVSFSQGVNTLKIAPPEQRKDIEHANKAILEEFSTILENSIAGLQETEQYDREDSEEEEDLEEKEEEEEEEQQEEEPIVKRNPLALLNAGAQAVEIAKRKPTALFNIADIPDAVIQLQAPDWNCMPYFDGIPRVEVEAFVKRSALIWQAMGFVPPVAPTYSTLRIVEKIEAKNKEKPGKFGATHYSIKYRSSPDVTLRKSEFVRSNGISLLNEENQAYFNPFDYFVDRGGEVSVALDPPPDLSGHSALLEVQRRYTVDTLYVKEIDRNVQVFGKVWAAPYKHFPRAMLLNFLRELVLLDFQSDV